MLGGVHESRILSFAIRSIVNIQDTYPELKIEKSSFQFKKESQTAVKKEKATKSIGEASERH